MSLITTINIAKSYGAEDIFSGITLSIPYKARIGLVGENGVGKTTLLRILLGEEEPSAGQVQRAKNLRIGYLPQETLISSGRTLWEECLSALDELTSMQAELQRLETFLAEDPANQEIITRYGALLNQFDRMGGFTFENEIERTLTGLGFNRKDYHKPLNLLSGGQRTRAALARLLLSNPDLLLLDEPTNHLDIQAMEWLEGFLKHWDGAVLIVSHDRYFLDQIVDQIWELTPDLEIYRGNYSAYMRQREERYQRQMKNYEAQQMHIAKEEEYIRRNIAGQNSRQAQGRLKRLERMLRDAHLAKPQSHRHIRLTMNGVKRSGDLVVRTYNLKVGYQDDGKVLIEVPDLTLMRGERAAVIGPNGAGKTTFLKTLMGYLPPLDGEVKLGANVSIGYFAQAHEKLHPHWTLLREVQKAAPEMLEAQARDYLAKYLFSGDDVYKEVRALSGGERGRLALACLALQGANLLLLDEPTNHLDLSSQEILQRVIAEFPGTVLLVSHDRYLIDAVATQVWEILPGQKSMQIYQGNYSQMRAEELEKGNAKIAEREKRKEDAKRSKYKESAPNINPLVLRDLEEQIGQLENQLEAVTAKLEKPLEATESISELGEQYNAIKKALDEKWGIWESLFSD